MEAKQLYIDGEYVDAVSGRTFETINPATGKPICKVQEAGREDVDLAVESAKKAYRQWSQVPGRERGRVLRKAADILRSRNDEIARLEVQDTGKPISEALEVDIQTGADALEYYGGLADKMGGRHVDLPPSAFVYTRREPLGVCAGIGAWNYPIQIACWKSAIALACGNTMVFKPSELTPLTTLMLAETYLEAGLPAGAFNVVQGAAETGRLLSRHPDVAKVSLTGEVETGKKVMADAAGTLKHVTVEMGGKSPLIIFGDSDLDNAVSAAMMANFYTQGEICSNGTRVFVEEPVRGQFLERLLSRVEKMRIGDPRDPETHVGALISEEHMQKVLGYIESGVSEGAEVLIGGKRCEREDLASGYFVEPTVFGGCTDEMKIVREEIFGPVMSVLSFEEEDEVVARANDTHYGLAAGVFTRDIARAHRVAGKLEAGVCWINNYNLTPTEMPFGGVKQSGLGRENGVEAVEHYTQIKSVYVELGDVEAPY